MPDRVFRANIYDLQPEGPPDGRPPTGFEDVMSRVSSLPLGDREKTINQKIRRMEDYDVRNGLHFANLLAFEYGGHGRVRSDRPKQDIALAEDEYFAPETALLYDPVNNLLFLESSTVTGASTLAKYFALFAPVQTSYRLVPRLDEHAAARARRFQSIRSIDVDVAIGPPTMFDRDSGLGAVQAFAREFDGKGMTLSIKAGRARRSSLFGERFRNAISELLDSGNDLEKIDVRGFKARGSVDADGELEVIDLLQHRERRARPLPIDPERRCVSHELRWSALDRIHEEFQQGG